MGVWAYVQKKDGVPKRVPEGYVIYERGGVKNKPPKLSRQEEKFCRLVYIENLALRHTRREEANGIILKDKDEYTVEEYQNAPSSPHRGDRKKEAVIEEVDTPKRIEGV